MVWLTKEFGLVRRHGIDQVDRFGLETVLVEKKIAVCFRVGHAGGAHRLTKAPSTMVSLVGGILIPL